MAPERPMSVRVLFFASLKEITGTAELQVSLPEAVSLAELIERLAGDLPDNATAALAAENVRVAINQTLTSGPARVAPGDEVAFLPPVTGG